MPSLQSDLSMAKYCRPKFCENVMTHPAEATAICYCPTITWIGLLKFAVNNCGFSLKTLKTPQIVTNKLEKLDIDILVENGLICRGISPR